MKGKVSSYYNKEFSGKGWPDIKDKNNDGTIMLFPPNENGSYFTLGEQDPNTLKNSTTDSHKEFVQYF